MIEVLIGKSLFPLRDVSQIRAGNIFRMSDGGKVGTLVEAVEDPRQEPHPQNADVMVWHVTTKVAKL